MKKCYLVSLCLILPIVTSLVTYTFISAGNDVISLDENQSLILLLSLVKLVLLGGTGIFPINLNKLMDSFLGAERRDLNYRLPPVTRFPCLRRLLCETETAARTSDRYSPEAAPDANGRNLEEEISPDEDPLTEMQIEAIKAFYREKEPLDGLSARTRRALQILEGLTGKSCDLAYRYCGGRITGKKFFLRIFKEMQYEAEEIESNNLI